MSEIKSVKKPSKAILTLMTAVCIILGVEPKMVKREGAYAEYDEDWWTPATSSKVLGNGQLQDILASFDPGKQLTIGIMERLQEYTSDEEFNVTNIARASKAAQGKSPRPKFQYNCSRFCQENRSRSSFLVSLCHIHEISILVFRSVSLAFGDLEVFLRLGGDHAEKRCSGSG